MEGWNGGRGSSWSYGHEIRSNISSSSGTIVSNLSTAYASSGSRFSTSSIEAAMHFDFLRIHEEHDGDNMDGMEEAEEQEETSEDPIRSLVQEFFSANSANCSIRSGDMSAMKRWVILSLKDGAFSRKELRHDAWSWVRALDQIAQTVCFTGLQFPDAINLRPYHLAPVIQEAMLKILTFVDTVVAWDPNSTEEFLSMGRIMLPPYNKLISLLGAHGVLSEASYKILTQINRSTYAKVRRIENEMTILLSEFENKLGEAIRSTKEKIRMMSMEKGNDSLIPLNPEGSSDIHKVTRSVMSCIRFLCANYSSLDSAIRAKNVPHSENIPPLDNMIMEMVSCVQGKLASISELLADQGLRSLFLLNNSYFMLQQLQHYSYSYSYSIEHDLTRKTNAYMERYLQVSWAPLLLCLFNPTPLCLGKNYSPLSKFESEFHKIYTTQKQWKVPDPLLRRRMRGVIMVKIIPRYREYVEDNKVTNPKISILKAMLQELFEG